MKFGRVVVVVCMAEFMEYDKLAEVLGKEHDKERNADTITTTT